LQVSVNRALCERALQGEKFLTTTRTAAATIANPSTSCSPMCTCRTEGGCDPNGWFIWCSAQRILTIATLFTC